MKRVLPFLRLLPLALLVGLSAVNGRAQSGFAFHGTGDLAGGPAFSVIRDATRASDGTIYAVGGSAAVNQVLCVGPNNPVGCVPSFAPDTSILWTWDGSSAQLTALPNLVANPTATSGIQASAITPDAAFIASQARSVAVGGNRLAVRVERSLLPGSGANTNLNVAPFATYTQPTAAAAISSNGSVLAGNVNPSVRAARFDFANGAGNVLIPLLRASDTNNQVTVRGISANGNAIIGTSFAQPYSGTLGGQAFKYFFNPMTNTGNTSGIPFLPGGSWSRASAISPNGRFTLVTGNSTTYSNGEVAIHDGATNTFTTLGSPNTPWTPSPLAGMTADGSVVAVTFNAANGYHDGYFRNQHGWFHLESAFASNGLDVKAQGWRQFFVAGISADGTLVYGQGLHNGNTEGFVAEFPAGYLANYDVPAQSPSDTSIVGTWMLQEPGQPASGALVFMADGSFYLIEPNAAGPTEAPGFERGRYLWNPTTGALRVTTLQDTNGDSGASGGDGNLAITAFITGDSLTITDPLDDSDGPITLQRLQRVEGTAIGGWVGGDPNVPDSSLIFVGMPDGTYFFAQDYDPAQGPGGWDGVEAGTFAYNASTGELSGVPSVDTNGDTGFSDPVGPVLIHIAADDLTASGTDDEGDPLFIRRVIDPNSVRPSFTNAGSANATLNAPFTFVLSATYHAYAFTASGLPAGLSIDGATGVISGTPTIAGVFVVNVTASNSLATGSGALVITVNAPTITRSGFYAPVKAGVNDQKGGSTVPLKFNVSVNGVEKTDTAGLVFTLTKVICSTGAAISPAPFSMTGGTALRYEGGQFIANWKTPSDAGACYVVRMTTTADGGSISATFKLK